MTISDDTAALVTAQLTAAWARLEASNPNAAALPEDQTRKRVLDTYLNFQALIAESDTTPGAATMRDFNASMRWR